MENNTLALIQRIDALEQRVQALESGEAVNLSIPQPMTKPLSLKEFLLTKKPSDDVKKTLAIGYYLEKYEHLTSFNTKDIELAFRHAKETPPRNINDKVNIAIRGGGLLVEAREKKNGLKAWSLTNTGENFVEKSFKK